MARRGWTGKYVKRVGVGVLARFNRIGSFARMRGREWRGKRARLYAANQTEDYAEFFDLIVKDAEAEAVGEDGNEGEPDVHE